MKCTIAELSVLKHALATCQDVLDNVNEDAKVRESHLQECVLDLARLVKHAHVEVVWAISPKA